MQILAWDIINEPANPGDTSGDVLFVSFFSYPDLLLSELMHMPLPKFDKMRLQDAQSALQANLHNDLLPAHTLLDDHGQPSETEHHRCPMF